MQSFCIIFWEKIHPKIHEMLIICKQKKNKSLLKRKQMQSVYAESMKFHKDVPPD